MCGFHTHNLWHRVYLLVYFLLPIFKILYQIPVTFRYTDAVAYSYCDTEINFCQLFQHPHNWRYSSTSQPKIPVSSTNLTEHFKTFHTFISRLTSVLAFAIIFDTISRNIRHKTHLRYYFAYDSWYDSRTRNVFRIVPYKTDSKNVTGRRELQWDTDRQTPPVARNSVSKLCEYWDVQSSADMSELTQ